MSFFLLFFILQVSFFAKADSVGYYSYKYSKNEPAHIDGEELGTCFGLLAFNYHGASRMNSTEMTRPYDSGEFKNYLMAKPARKTDFTTGQEPQLRDWILQQKDNSVTPFSLFQESLKIHKGNSWNAILAIHEVLRDHARHFSKRNFTLEYKINSSDAANLFNKLIDIRGDLKDKGGDNVGDHRGSWYRMWGMMLYQIKSNSRLFNQKTNCIIPENTLSSLGASAAAIQGHMVARGAEWMKHLLPGDKHPTEDNRKIEYNLLGVSSMEAMDEYLKNPFSTQAPPSEILKRCQQSHYLKKGSPE